MEKIVVEYNGALRQVTVEQLTTLVRRGFISPDARAFVDGEDCLARDVLRAVAGGSSAASLPEQRVGWAAGLPASARETTNAAMPIPEVAGGAVNAATVEESSEMLALEELATSSGESSEERKPLALKLVVGVCVAAILIALVVAVVVARSGADNNACDVDANVASAPGNDVAEDEEVESEVVNVEPEAPEPIDWNAPFDDSLETLAPDFRGCDFLDLYFNLNGVFQIYKEKFETTPEFEARRAEFMIETLQKPILNNITPTSRVAVTIDELSNVYNADAGTFKFRLSSFVGDASILLMQNYETSTYEGQNIYSVTKTIAKRVYEKYGIIVNLAPDERLVSEFTLAIPPDQARDLNDNLKAILAFTIDRVQGKYSDSYEATKSNYSHEKPTLDYPRETVEYAYAVYAKDPEIWIYNDKTGDVLLKSKVCRNRNLTDDEDNAAEESIVHTEDANASSNENEPAATLPIRSFDPTVSNVEPDYQCVDIKRFASVVSHFWRTLDQGVGETDSDYRARRREFLTDFPDAPLVDDAKAGDWFAYALSSRRSAVEQHYLRENKGLSLKILGASFAKTESARKGSCLIATEEDAPNIVAADGVTRNVVNEREFTEEDGLFFLYPCTSAEADDLYGHVNALVLFTLDDAIYAKFEPGRDYKPIDLTFSRLAADKQEYECGNFQKYQNYVLGDRVYVKGLQVWFYDNRTGDVLKKYSLSNAKSWKEKGKSAGETKGKSTN